MWDVILVLRGQKGHLCCFCFIKGHFSQYVFGNLSTRLHYLCVWSVTVRERTVLFDCLLCCVLFWWMELLSGRWLSILQTRYHTPGGPKTKTKALYALDHQHLDFCVIERRGFPFSVTIWQFPQIGYRIKLKSLNNFIFIFWSLKEVKCVISVQLASPMHQWLYNYFILTFGIIFIQDKKQDFYNSSTLSPKYDGVLVPHKKK